MNSHFKYLIQPIPEGEAVTGHELEVQLLKTLDASKGTCLDSLRMLAMLYQMSGHLERSIECIQQRNDLLEDPEELAAGYMSLGQLEETKRDYTAASKHYRRALSLEPCSTETWYFIHNNLGYSLYQLGDDLTHSKILDWRWGALANMSKLQSCSFQPRWSMPPTDAR